MRKFTVEIRHGLRPEGRIEFGEREKKRHCRAEASVGKGAEVGLIDEPNESLQCTLVNREVSR